MILAEDADGEKRGKEWGWAGAVLVGGSFGMPGTSDLGRCFTLADLEGLCFGA